MDSSTIVVGLIGAVLFLTRWTIPSKRNLTIHLLLVIGLLQLVGGAVTVLPFSFLPFSPEQTTGHYLAHVIYSVLQIPLVIFRD